MRRSILKATRWRILELTFGCNSKALLVILCDGKEECVVVHCKYNEFELSVPYGAKVFRMSKNMASTPPPKPPKPVKIESQTTFQHEEAVNT